MLKIFQLTSPNKRGMVNVEFKEKTGAIEMPTSTSFAVLDFPIVG
jgi:hypothetical protein